MPQTRSQTGVYTSSLTPEDQAMFRDWIRQKRDINVCIDEIYHKFGVAWVTAYGWMNKACKEVGKSKTPLDRPL